MVKVNWLYWNINDYFVKELKQSSLFSDLFLTILSYQLEFRCKIFITRLCCVLSKIEKYLGTRNARKVINTLEEIMFLFVFITDSFCSILKVRGHYVKGSQMEIMRFQYSSTTLCNVQTRKHTVSRVGLFIWVSMESVTSVCIIKTVFRFIETEIFFLFFWLTRVSFGFFNRIQ